MTVRFDAGYTLPPGDLPLKNARILHAGNRAQVRQVATNIEVAGFPAEAVDNGLSYDVWKPFSNDVLSPNDLTGAGWSLVNATVLSDNQTLVENTAAGQHVALITNVTYTATEHVVGVRIRLRKGAQSSGIQIVLSDGTNFPFGTFDLRSKIVHQTGGTGLNAAAIVDLGNNEYMLKVVFTPGATATGQIQVRLLNSSLANNYTGDGISGATILETVVHRASAYVDLNLYSSTECDLVCIAGHNLGDSYGRVLLQENSGGSYVTFDFTDLENNSPLMCIFEPITSAGWRIYAQRAVLPEFAVVRVGKALQMDQAFYGGFQPSLGRRQTVVRGTRSEGGQWLGRSIVRRQSNAEYQWTDLPFNWARTNLMGPNGLVQALEREPFFLAWRPGELGDVDYGWTGGPVGGPTNQGGRPRVDFGFSAQVLGFNDSRFLDS